jgi:fibronectin-binding autotransporter adhesin
MTARGFGVLDIGMPSVGGRTRAGMLVTAIAVLLLLVGVSAAQATTWDVTNTGDGASTCPSASSCTLRGAVANAANGDMISLSAGTYTLNGAKGEIDIEANVSIVGAGASVTTITAAPASELLYVESADVDISGVTFRGGSVGSASDEGEGGAIYNDGGELQISDSAFTDNTANGSDGEPKHEYGDGGYGGAIYSEDGELSVTSSSFTGNTAAGGYSASQYEEGGYGGAIYSEDGELSVTSSSFSGNTATGSSKGTGGVNEYEYGGGGGGIYSEDGTAALAGDSFSDNSAQGGTAAATVDYAEGGYGGAFYDDDGTATISASTISANSATGGAAADGGTHAGETGYGGGVYVEDGSATITGSTLSGNTVIAGGDASGSNYGDGGEGGGIYSEDGDLELSGDTVTGNSLPQDTAAKDSGDGAGVFTEDGSATITLSNISENQAPDGYGAGLYTEEGSTTVSQSTFRADLAAGGDGGGIYSDDGRLSLEQSTVGPSDAAEYGAGVYHDYGPLAITNTTIADNTASYEGGGIYNEGVANLANDSLVANTAQNADGGGNLYLDEHTLTLHDSLIAAGVSPTSGGNCAFEKSGSIESYGYNAEDGNQCTLGGPGNQLNATLNLGPLQSNGGPTQTIALGAGSQAIDNGDPAGCTDAEGNPLTVDQRGIGRPQGPRCDIGAFEVVVPPVAPTPTPASPPTPKPTAATITSFATTITVKLSSGAGTLAAGCGAPADESCAFTLTLFETVKHGHKTTHVKLGSIAGAVQGGHVGKLTVKLDATGRKLLEHGTLHLEAKGTVRDTAGLLTQFHRDVTIKKKK